MKPFIGNRLLVTTFVALFLLPGLTVSAKIKALSAQDEKRWIENVQSFKTEDGNSVKDILKYAEITRPRKFKVSEIGVGYSGATGEPTTVYVSYWVGLKRKSDEVYVDLSFQMKKNGQIEPGAAQANTLTSALQKGKTAFVMAIDQAYEDACKDIKPGKYTC